MERKPVDPKSASYADLMRENERLAALLNDSAQPFSERRKYFAPYTQVQQEMKRRNDAALDVRS